MWENSSVRAGRGGPQSVYGDDGIDNLGPSRSQVLLPEFAPVFVRELGSLGKIGIDGNVDGNGIKNAELKLSVVGHTPMIQVGGANECDHVVNNHGLGVNINLPAGGLLKMKDLEMTGIGRAKLVDDLSAHLHVNRGNDWEIVVASHDDDHVHVAFESIDQPADERAWPQVLVFDVNVTFRTINGTPIGFLDGLLATRSEGIRAKDPFTRQRLGHLHPRRAQGNWRKRRGSPTNWFDHSTVPQSRICVCRTRIVPAIFEHFPNLLHRRAAHSCLHIVPAGLAWKVLVEAKQVYVVGHSRGGLVGRVAKEKLRNLGYGCQVNLVTFGTPHLGTPLAKIGARMLNLLFKLGSDLVGMIPHATPLAMAYSYLLGGAALPPGLDVMREDSDALALLNAIGDSSGSECWASRFDMNAGPSGFGVELEGILMGAMGSVANDLVVPASSALAFGEGHPLLTCSHLSYFQQPEVQNFFDSLAARAVVPIGKAFAAAASTSMGQAAPSAGALSYQPEQVRVGNVRTQKQQFR